MKFTFFALFDRRTKVDLPGVDFLVQQKLRALDAIKGVNADIKTAVNQRVNVVKRMEAEIENLNEAAEWK